MKGQLVICSIGDVPDMLGRGYKCYQALSSKNLNRLSFGLQALCG